MGRCRLLLADCTDTGALRGYAQMDSARLQAMLATDPAPGAECASGPGLSRVYRRSWHRRRSSSGYRDDRREHRSRTWRCTTFAPASSCAAWFISRATGPADGWRAAAFVLEKIAGAGGIDPEMSEDAQEEEWRTATILAATLTDAELLDDNLEPERLLYRLFHAEGVVVDRARALSFGCRCSRARLAGILEGFSADDLDHMAVEGDIVMTCEFCNYDFRFPRDGVRGRQA